MKENLLKYVYISIKILNHIPISFLQKNIQAKNFSWCLFHNLTADYISMKKDKYEQAVALCI